jgi:rhodanese-related sulfurtransferase
MKLKSIKPKISKYLPGWLIAMIAALVLGVGVGFVLLKIPQFNLATMISSWGVPQITVQELVAGKVKPVLLVDVRSPSEYTIDHIGNSPLVPITDIEQGLGEKAIVNLVKKSTLPNQAAPTLILYCETGFRSNKSSQMLEKSGLKSLVLTGGIQAWRQSITPEKDQLILKNIL